MRFGLFGGLFMVVFCQFQEGFAGLVMDIFEIFLYFSGVLEGLG